ncbi:MAG: T9SS type A sorting domain-containing protein [Nonlabens sp.]|uniref:T9SS type A sorting domain-containing protein n=1 Tax=Nonlabens sp. TaxID=1888209 RepID=UPI003EF2D5B5
MKKSILLVVACLSFVFAQAQTTYYVSQQTGTSGNNGTSPSTPFNDIDDAVNAVSAGDTIKIMGVYANSSYDANYSYSGNINDPQLWHQENSMRINNLNGTPNNYITITSFDSNTRLKGDGANILRLANCSYLKITDLIIEGEVNNISLSTAKACQFLYRTNGSSNTQYRVQPGTTDAQVGQMTFPALGNVSRPSYTDTRGMYLTDVHHIDIERNHIRLMPGGGMRVSKCDYINIKENEVENCSRKSFSGTHGLVVTNAQNGTDTNDGYKIFIERNRVHHNYNEIYSWAPTKTIITPEIDEGKGISLQRNDIDDNNTPNNPNDDTGWLRGRILIANNICYYNGYSGIHSNSGTRIDIINNTCYFNSYTKSIYLNQPSNNGGNIGISIQGGTDFKIINNISIIDSNQSKSAIAINVTAPITVKDNIIYGTAGAINTNAATVAVEQNTRMVNPLFMDAANFDFRLQANSPAINSADAAFAPSDDFNQFQRDSTPDLGALEFGTTAGIDDVTVSVAIYPNPTSGIVNWETTSTIENIQLYNLAGQELQARRSSNSMDLSALPRGVYILVLDSASYKIMKE